MNRTSRRLSDLFVMTMLAVYLVASLGWLVIGIAPAIAGSSERVHTWLHELGGSSDEMNTSESATWIREAVRRAAAVSHLEDTPEIHPRPQGIGRQTLIEYLFSAVNFILAVVVVSLRPRDWAARFLAVGLAGTAAVFNPQAHSTLSVIPTLGGNVHRLFHLIAGVAYVLALRVFPDGRLVPRWKDLQAEQRGLRVLGLVLLGMFGYMFVSLFHGEDPSGFVIFFGIVIPGAGLASQGFRYRDAKSQPEKRTTRALLWLLGSVLILTLLLGVLGVAFSALSGTDAAGILDDMRTLAISGFPLLYTLIPIGLVAILIRHHLWSIERIVNKALLYATMVLFIGLVYVTAVVALSTLFGESIIVSTVSAGIAAVSFAPLRERSRRLANLLIFGKRVSPYEVLAQLADRAGGSYSIEETLPQMARLLAEGLGAGSVEIWMSYGAESRLAASVGLDGPRSDAEVGNAREVEIRYQGEELGRIRVERSARDPFKQDEDRLLEEVSAQAALFMSNHRLTEELKARVEEVSRQAEEISASRLRMASAAQDERRRLERDLHDGAQARLLSVSAKLKEASELLRKSPAEAAHVVEELGADVEETTEELRSIARGLFPSALVDLGLVPALKGIGRQSRIPVKVTSREMDTRSPQEVETAVYYCCVEAIQNATKHSRATSIELSLQRIDGLLVFSVIDDGTGFDPPPTRLGRGLQNMVDRVESLGGTLTIGRLPRGGTAVEGRVPNA